MIVIFLPKFFAENRKWEQTKVNGAKVITNKRLKKIFKHYNGWKKFHKKHGKSLRKYAMPIFSKNYNYCIFYSSNQSDWLDGGGNIILYKFVNNKWVFVKTYSFWIS